MKMKNFRNLGCVYTHSCSFLFNYFRPVSFYCTFRLGQLVLAYNARPYYPLVTISLLRICLQRSQVHSKIVRKVQRVREDPLPQTGTASPIVNSIYQRSKFVPLTHHSHSSPWSILGFPLGVIQMYNDMYLSL